MFSLGVVPPPLTPHVLAKDKIAGGYTMIPQKFYNPSAARNALGLVGGNDVSLASGNLVDVESDLLGITRDRSKVPARQFQPTKDIVYIERGTGATVHVNTAPRHLPTMQMVSYPGVPAPAPLYQEIYGSPWRF
jgi:hypothetical protein